jgi:hypothetical protein
MSFNPPSSAFVGLPRATFSPLKNNRWPLLQTQFLPQIVMNKKIIEHPASMMNQDVPVHIDAMASTPTFDPVVPDLSGFVVIVIFCVAAAWVWANQVVPVARTNLAISKRSGPVADYLEELRQASTPITNATSETTMVSLESTGSHPDVTETESRNMKSRGGRALERWLFSDWLDKSERKSGRQKDPALPILPNAKWNSGDNPILAATALILLGVVCTSITERVASWHP